MCVIILKMVLRALFLHLFSGTKPVGQFNYRRPNEELFEFWRCCYLTNFLLLALLPFCSGERIPLCNTVRNGEHFRENVLNFGQHLRCYLKSRPTMYSLNEYD